MTDAGGHRGSYVDPIDLLRAHVAKHSIKDSAFFSIKGLTVLLDELDRWKAHAIGLEHRVSELKTQNERLIAKEGERISKELRRIEKYEGEPK